MWHHAQAARLETRSAQEAVRHHLANTVGVSQVVARGIADDLPNILRVAGADAPERGPYQVRHKAVAHYEPAGKPLSMCTKVDVALTLVDPVADTEPGCSASERTKRRILRLCQEAIRQGAILSYEDLSLLLGLERTTIGKYIRGLKEDGHPILTRADVTKSSRNQTHKRIVVLMYLSGATEMEIVRRAKHGLERVNQYLSAFIRVAVALKNGVQGDLIGKVCGLSKALAQQYLDIYAEAVAAPVMARNLEEWIRRVEAAPKKGAPRQ
jgi:biotin operon repressor